MSNPMVHDGVTTSSPLRRSRRIRMQASTNNLSPQLKAASRSSGRRRRSGVTEGSSPSSSTTTPMADHQTGRRLSSTTNEGKDIDNGPRSIKSEATEIKVEPTSPQIGQLTLGDTGTKQEPTSPLRPDHKATDNLPALYKVEVGPMGPPPPRSRDPRERRPRNWRREHKKKWKWVKKQINRKYLYSKPTFVTILVFSSASA